MNRTRAPGAAAKTMISARAQNDTAWRRDAAARERTRGRESNNDNNNNNNNNDNINNSSILV